MPKIIEMQEKTAKFFKDAFCVDGEARIVFREFKAGAAIELNDSKRGKFYVAIVDPCTACIKARNEREKS